MARFEVNLAIYGKLAFNGNVNQPGYMRRSTLKIASKVISKVTDVKICIFKVTLKGSRRLKSDGGDGVTSHFL